MKRSISVLGGVILAVLAGCSQPGGDERDLRLMRGRPFEPDIPVPAGFTLVEQASEDRSTGSRRLYLRHLYKGKESKYAVRNFYREQMPLAQWTKMSDGNVKGHVSMRYEKGGESATISITGDTGTFDTWTEVQIVVSRVEKGRTPPATASKS